MPASPFDFLTAQTSTAPAMRIPAFQLMLLGALVATVAPGARALPESEASAGRLIARRYADTIVDIRGSVFLKVTMSFQALPPREWKFDVSGTLIGASGLTATSLSAIDARAVFESMRSNLSTSGQAIELVQTEFKNLRLLMGDGTEVPAKILWKDPVHDLVLIVPDRAEEGNRSYPFVDLRKAAESVSLLGNYYQLSRTGAQFQYALLVRESTVICIVERPERLLLTSTNALPDALGCPVFDQEGRVLGINLNKMEKDRSIGVVLFPAADLAAVITKAFPNQ